MNPNQVLNLVITLLGITPEIFDKIATLRAKAGKGQEVTSADLDSLISTIEARSGRIQSA